MLATSPRAVARCSGVMLSSAPRSMNLHMYCRFQLCVVVLGVRCSAALPRIQVCTWRADGTLSAVLHMVHQVRPLSMPQVDAQTDAVKLQRMHVAGCRPHSSIPAGAAGVAVQTTWRFGSWQAMWKQKGWARQTAWCKRGWQPSSCVCCRRHSSTQLSTADRAVCTWRGGPCTPSCRGP